jgi:hypothetical protein
MNIKRLLISAAFLCTATLSFSQNNLKDERYKDVLEYSARVDMLEGKEYDNVKKWAESNPTILKIQKDSASNYDEIRVVAVTRLKKSDIEFMFSKENLKVQLVGLKKDARLFTIFYEYDYDLLKDKINSTEVMQRIHY